MARRGIVLIITATIISVGSVSNMCYAGGGLGGRATEMTQLANNAELAKSVSNQATQITHQVTQIQNQITQIENMIYNTMNLPNQIISDFTQNLNRIRSVAYQIEGMSYHVANLGERFQSQFQGFTPTDDYVGVYRDLAKQTRQTSENAIRFIENMANENAQDSQKLHTLAQASGNAEGHQQAIQAGNQLLAFLGEQALKLQELNMSYSTAIIEQIQSQNEKDERIEANIQEMLSGLKGKSKSIEITTTSSLFPEL